MWPTPPTPHDDRPSVVESVTDEARCELLQRGDNHRVMTTADSSSSSSARRCPPRRLRPLPLLALAVVVVLRPDVTSAATAAAAAACFVTVRGSLPRASSSSPPVLSGVLCGRPQGRARGLGAETSTVPSRKHKDRALASPEEAPRSRTTSWFVPTNADDDDEAKQGIHRPRPTTSSAAATASALLGAATVAVATTAFAAGLLGSPPPASASAIGPIEKGIAAVAEKSLVAPEPAWSTFNTIVVASATPASDDTNAAASAAAVAKLDGKDPAYKLFQQGRVLESQGNYDATLQIYQKVTTIRPNFVYGWSNLGNAQVVFQDLDGAETSYSTAIQLCQDIESSLESASSGDGATTNGFMGGLSLTPKCDDLYVILLNRGCLRLNHNQPKEALADLELSNSLRARPDAVILQNLARAQELNGNFVSANDNYDLAIQMTSNEVSPFWLRSALVKYQIGNLKGGFDLLKRVRNRFPDAPEVKAAYAVFLYRQSGGTTSGTDNGADNVDAATTEARQLFLEIPDRARKQFSDDAYVRTTIGWPPAMVETLRKIAVLVGDRG